MGACALSRARFRYLVIPTGLAKTMKYHLANEAWWRWLEWMKHVPLTVPNGQKVSHQLPG